MSYKNLSFSYSFEANRVILHATLIKNPVVKISEFHDTTYHNMEKLLRFTDLYLPNFSDISETESILLFSIQYFIRFKSCYFRHSCSLILEARFGGAEAPGANQGNENCCPEQVRLHGARLVVGVIFIIPSSRILGDGIPNGYWINVAVLCNIEVVHQCCSNLQRSNCSISESKH